MADQPAKPQVTEQQLPACLLQHVPALTDAYTSEMEDRPDDPPSAYFVLSFVLKPHLIELLNTGDEQEVRRIFDLLEYLAEHGDVAVQNELWVTMEEMDVWRVWRYLGPRLRAGELERVTQLLVDPVANAHIDRDHYRKRWEEEIENIGGWEHLTAEHKLWIWYLLVKEFEIVGVQPTEPGSAEWRARGLSWPLSDSAR